METVLESGAALAVPDQQLFDRAREYTAAARAHSTRRIYRTFWLQFEAWAIDRGRAYLPADPETVALYLADLAESTRPRRSGSKCRLSRPHTKPPGSCRLWYRPSWLACGPAFAEKRVARPARKPR